MLEANHADIPSCAECKEWMFDKDWRPTKHLGQRVPRGKTPTPCWKCPKGPVPFENEPTRTTLLTIEYFYACQADDSGFLLARDRRVVENNALILKIRERMQREAMRALPLLALVTETKGKK